MRSLFPVVFDEAAPEAFSMGNAVDTLTAVTAARIAPFSADGGSAEKELWFIPPQSRSAYCYCCRSC